MEFIVTENYEEMSRVAADLICYALYAAKEIQEYEPRTYQEAVQSNEAENWLKAIHEEMDSLKKNQTWILVKQPEGKSIISCKWIFKRKVGIPGVEASRFKARLVARGFLKRRELITMRSFLLL